MNAKADQAEPYTLWGVACSLYTGPVRSYLIKKGLGYRERNPSAPEFAARIVPTVKSVVVPVLETPEGEILQDSVEIIQRLETRVAEPALNPPTPVQRVVARLLEAFGAEYMLRLAMHYRWSYRAEQEDFLCAEFGRGTYSGPDRELQRKAGKQRMEYFSGFLPGLGVTPESVPALESAYAELLDALDAHFQAFPYFLGGRPSAADFGMMGPLFAHLGPDGTTRVGRRRAQDPPHARPDRVRLARHQGPSRQRAACLVAVQPRRRLRAFARRRRQGALGCAARAHRRDRGHGLSPGAADETAGLRARAGLSVGPRAASGFTAGGERPIVRRQNHDEERPLTIQLRQICLVAATLKPVIEALEDVFGLCRCYVDPNVAVFGLENTLLPVGRNFLEVVAPTRAGTAGGRYLERRSGDGGYMVITQADTREAWRAMRQRALDHKVRVAYQKESDDWSLCQFHPADMIAAFLEVEWDAQEDFRGRWMPAGGHGWEDKVRQDVTVDFAGVELQGEDPQHLARSWSKVLDLPHESADRDFAIRLNNASLRFVAATDGRGAGLGGVDLLVRDRAGIVARAKRRGVAASEDRVDLCGVRFYLRDAPP